MRIGGVAILLLLAAQAALSAETLDDAWGCAVAHNPSLESVRLLSEAAQQDAVTVASERWPTASLRTGYLTRTSEPSFLSYQPALGVPTLRLPYAQDNAASLSATASVPLWTGGRIEQSIQAAEARSTAYREKNRWEEMQLRMLVAELFVRVLHAEQLVQVETRLLQSARQSAVDQAELATKSRATERDVNASRVAVLKASQQLIRAQTSLAHARAAYNQALGRPVGAEVALVSPDATLLPESLEQLCLRAVGSRPDLLEAVQRATACEREAAACRAANRPQLSAEFTYGYETNRYQTPQGVGAAGVFVDWDALSPGKPHQARAAELRAAAARSRLRDVRSQVAVQIHQAWNDRAAAISEEQLSAEVLTLAQQQHHSVEQRAAQGLAVPAESLRSDAEVVKAEARLINARTARVLAQLRLRFTAGLLESGR